MFDVLTCLLKLINLLAKSLNLQIWIVSLCVHILDDLVEVSLVNVDLVRILSTSSSQLLCVRVQVVVQQGHLHLAWVLYHLVHEIGVYLASDLFKDIVTLSCKR